MWCLGDNGGLLLPSDVFVITVGDGVVTSKPDCGGSGGGGGGGGGGDDASSGSGCCFGVDGTDNPNFSGLLR